MNIQFKLFGALDLVKDLDTGLITKHLDQYVIQSCKNKVSSVGIMQNATTFKYL